MGETASGKSDLALRLAQHFDAEIIGADSRQIYHGMQIGTAAPTEEQRRELPHHLIGFLDPNERYSAARFVADTLAHIQAIWQRGRKVIIVGGTGFYIRALCGEMVLGPEQDQEIRRRILHEGEVHPVEWLHEWLGILDPERAAQLHTNDRYRITRSLEMVFTQRAAATTETAQHAGVSTLASLGIAWQKFWLVQDPPVLEERIALRVARMLEDGLLAEAERIGGDAVAASAVGYHHALAYLAGQATYEELREQLRRATRQYAKRQRTWLRREPGITALLADMSPTDMVETIGRACDWNAHTE
jgi:tRNA dimethylallyltransferase